MKDDNILTLVLFGVILVMSFFAYMPFSDDVSLTNNPNGIIDSYSIDSNWSEEGTLDNLVSDGEILYAESNQVGNWTSIIQDEPNSRTINLEAEGDPREGDIVFYINSWEELPNGDGPDNTYVRSLNDFEIEEEFNASQYNYFNVVVEIEETSGNSNQRPYLDSFSLEFLNESNQYGFRSDDFQAISLFVLIGCGLIAMTRVIYE